MARSFRGSDGQSFDPSHRFVTSWLLPPAWLAACRALISVYIFASLLFVIGWMCQHPRLGGCAAAADQFSYFTVLTDWGLAFYFAVAAVHTATYARSFSSSSLLGRLPRPLPAMHAAFYSTITVLPFIVTGVYWGRLYDGPWFPVTFDAWHNVSQHALNSGFALFEIVVPRTALQPWLHLAWLILVLALYLALAYLTRFTKGFYVYSFLDPAHTDHGKLIPAYVFGIAVASVIVFCIVQGLLALRCWLTETKLGMTGKLAQGDRETADLETAQSGKA